MTQIPINQGVRTLAHRASGAIARRRFLSLLPVAMLWALGAALLVTVALRLWGPGAWGGAWWIPGLLGAGAAVLISGMVALRGRVSDERGAGLLDAKLGLESQLRSALELEDEPRGSGFTELAQRRASALAAGVSIEPALPPVVARAWWGPGVLALLIVAAGLWLPRMNPGRGPSPMVVPQGAIASIDEATGSLAEDDAGAGDEPEPVSEALRELEELKQELSQGVERQDEAAAKASAKLQKLADALEEDAEQTQRRGQELAEEIRAMQNLQRQQQRQTDPRVDEFARALQEQRFDDAAGQLDEIQNQSGQMSPEEREAIAQQLEELANALEPEPQDQPTPPNTGEDPSATESESQQRSQPSDEPRDELSESLRDEARQLREQPREPQRQDQQQGEQDQREQGQQGQDQREQEQSQGEGQPQEPREDGAREQGQEESGQDQQGRDEQRHDSQEPGDRGQEQGQREGEQTEQNEQGQGEQRQPSNENGSEQGQEQAQEQGQEQGQPDQQQREGGQDQGERPSQQPGAQPEEESGGQREQQGDEQGDEQAREQGGENGEPGDLRERLREMDERQRQAQRSRERAQEIRERAQELIEPAPQRPQQDQQQNQPGASREPSQPPPSSQGGAGDGERTQAPPAVDAPDAVRDYLPVDASGDEQGESGDPVGKWYAPEGETPPQGDAQQASQRLRQAAQRAQKAVDQQQVPRKYRHLVREVFKRVEDRANELGGTGKIAPQGQDATPKGDNTPAGDQG